ncbi:thiol peroxidase [Succinatimonas hippei]|uniref:thiol peroxidase n=1 Tax=Succinatimonas hippei TaxID=626938 RepID=UPI002011D0F2|nr:thiol peroxidase [Succinatimonas hippei]MCL1603152.1 thiol peroxidase [Succinatimonas hippei]
MMQVTFQNQPVTISGNLPKVGDKAPDFCLCTASLEDFKLSDHLGSVLILSIVPSLDTGVCATSARKFNQEAASLEGVKVLCISEDLPFAADRFCTAAGIKNVMTLSDFRKDDNFGENYGVMIKDSALRGLLTRSIFVIDKEGKIAYVELVPEITNEPNYAAAIEAANKCL